MHHYPFSDSFSNYVGGLGPTVLYAQPPSEVVHHQQHPLQHEEMRKDYDDEQDYPSLFGKNIMQTGLLDNQNTAAMTSAMLMFGATTETYLSDSQFVPFPFFATPAMFFEALPPPPHQQQPPQSSSNFSEGRCSFTLKTRDQLIPS